MNGARARECGAYPPQYATPLETDAKGGIAFHGRFHRKEGALGLVPESQRVLGALAAPFFL